MTLTSQRSPMPSALRCRSPMPMPLEHRLQVDIAPTGRPNFNSRRKLADVGDDLKPAFDTVTAELSGSA